MNTAQILPALPELTDRALRLAVAAYLARYKGQTRIHTESDLRSYLVWCAQQHLNPLEAQRPHVGIYLRWMQEVRSYEPSTVARRLSVGPVRLLPNLRHRRCVLDHSPADHVRRPPVPPESPTLGLSHLQFEAMLAAGRTSQNVNDFALVALLGLLGLRIFEATGASVEDLGEAHGYRVMRVHGKGDEIALVPLPPAVGRAVDRAIEGRDHGPLLRNRTGRRMDRHGAFVTTMLDAGVDLREVPTTSSPPSWPQPPSP